jgi:hypothetical protein
VPSRLDEGTGAAELLELPRAPSKQPLDEPQAWCVVIVRVLAILTEPIGNQEVVVKVHRRELFLSLGVAR